MNVPGLLPQSKSNQETTFSDEGSAAAWVDSDDERVVVSLVSNPRLRKLRISESEDLVNGKEYSKRLRRQFERLYPVPDWANSSAAKTNASKKRRKSSTASESSEANASVDDMSVGSDDLSTQPLAKLLQNTDSLTQLISTGSDVSRKLRPEVIDIHRTKDVGPAQPVGLLSSSLFLSLLTSLEPPVRHNQPRLSPRSFPPLIFRAFFYTLPTPCLSSSSKSQPGAHNSTPKFHSSNNFRFPPPNR